MHFKNENESKRQQMAVSSRVFKRQIGPAIVHPDTPVSFFKKRMLFIKCTMGISPPLWDSKAQKSV